jgi:serine phosphatase RsbU (regulator of sigma subunit)
VSEVHEKVKQVAELSKIIENFDLDLHSLKDRIQEASQMQHWILKCPSIEKFNAEVED